MDFTPYSAVLLDLDGTIYHEDHVLPGAAALVRRLRAQRILFACLTNSTLSPARVRARLLHMEMDIPERNIYTAAQAAADYVMNLPPRAGVPPRIFNLATESLTELLQDRVQWTDAHAALAGHASCDAVIAGSPASVFATEERQRAALVLLRAGAALLGMCADRVYPSPRGIEFGSGALTSMLAYAANVKPIYTGKPEPLFFHELCQRLAVPPERCILIGDNLESDIGGAKSVGMKTILTLTGVARREDLLSTPPAQHPDFVVETLESL